MARRTGRWGGTEVALNVRAHGFTTVRSGIESRMLSTSLACWSRIADDDDNDDDDDAE